jgi:transcription elongation factor S-II
MAEAELVSLFDKASKAAERAVDKDGEVLPAEEARCKEALKAMAAVEVSTALLLSTQVGKKLRKLTKHESKSISSSAQQLLNEWKKVVESEAELKSGTPNGTPKDESPKPGTPARAAKTEVKETKVYTSKNSRVETKSVVSSSAKPSPRVETKRVVTSTKVESKHVSQASPKMESKPFPKAELERSSSNPSSSSAISFEPKIGKLLKAGGDPTRDKVREMLIDSFKKCCSEITDEHLEMAKKADFVKVACAVETALFAKLGLMKGAEKAKYRSIFFNLKDDKNPDFRRRVLLGEIKPEEIVTMTADDMASDERKKANEEIRLKALFECERGQQMQASTDQFRCGKCGQRKTTYFELQTRSADEPMTAFITCVNCGARWKH